MWALRIIKLLVNLIFLYHSDSVHDCVFRLKKILAHGLQNYIYINVKNSYKNTANINISKYKYKYKQI